jgi:lysophospholipase L1-like esterase
MSDLPAEGIRRWLPTALLILPLIAHSLTFAATAKGQTIGLTDEAVFAVLIAYAVLAIIVVQQRPVLLRFLLVVYSMLIGAGLGEVILTWRNPTLRQRTPWPPIARTVQAADTMPGISGPITVTVNNLGLRGPEVHLEKVALKILCVGGSTTECIYVTDRKTWPWLLQEQLTESLHQAVFVGNAGRAGQFSLNHEYLLKEYAPVVKFDWVVLLCGVNDVGTFLRNNYELRRSQVPEETLTGKSSIYYRNLAMARVISDWLLVRRAEDNANVLQDSGGEWIAEAREKRQRALRTHTYTAVPQQLDAAVVRYRSDLHRIIETCRDRKLKLVMMTQPTLWAPKMPAELESLLLTWEDDGACTPGVLAEIMQAFNDAMRDVCRIDSVDCIDLESLIPKTTSIFYDDCHFNVGGCEAVAAIVAKFFEERLHRDGVISKRT